MQLLDNSLLAYKALLSSYLYSMPDRLWVMFMFFVLSLFHFMVMPDTLVAFACSFVCVCVCVPGCQAQKTQCHIELLSLE